MHWPEDLLVGGATKNKSGRLLKAKALQSMIQLMGEQEMFDYWRSHYKVHNIEWSNDKAKQVLEAWQRKFAEVSCSFVEFLLSHSFPSQFEWNLCFELDTFERTSNNSSSCYFLWLHFVVRRRCKSLTRMANTQESFPHT